MEKYPEHKGYFVQGVYFALRNKHTVRVAKAVSYCSYIMHFFSTKIAFLQPILRQPIKKKPTPATLKSIQLG